MPNRKKPTFFRETDKNFGNLQFLQSNFLWNRLKQIVDVAGIRIFRENILKILWNLKKHENSVKSSSRKKTKTSRILWWKKFRENVQITWIQTQRKVCRTSISIFPVKLDKTPKLLEETVWNRQFSSQASECRQKNVKRGWFTFKNSWYFALFG